MYGAGQFRGAWGALVVESGGALLSDDWALEAVAPGRQEAVPGG